MNNGMWRYRHAAALGLVALLAGCGGAGAGDRPLRHARPIAFLAM